MTDEEIWRTEKEHECEYFLAEGATVFVCKCGKLEVAGTVFYSEEELEYEIKKLIDRVIEMAESKTTIIVPMADFVKELEALRITHPERKKK